MNKDMYKRTFEAIKPSNDFIWEENSSHKKRQHLYIPKPALAAVIALAIVTSGSGVAYAANIAGFRDVVKIWFGGDYVESSIEETGDGQFTVTNADGESFVVGGFDEDGNPVPGEEIKEYLQGPDVIRDNDGRVWFYDKDYRQDITDDIADGEAHIFRDYGNEKKYIVVSIDEDGCFGMSFSDKSFEDAMR